MPAATDEILALQAIQDRCETYRQSLLRQIEAHQDTSRRLRSATAHKSLFRDALLDRIIECISVEDFTDPSTLEHVAIDISGWPDDTDIARKVVITRPDGWNNVDFQFTLIGYGGGIATYEVVRKC